MPCITHETAEERAEAARRHEQKITGPLHEETDTLKAELAERDAMLCGVLTCLETDGSGPELLAALAHFDADEAGVSIEAIRSWWDDHKKKDAERRAAEAAELEARKAQALKKLTLEERILLGFPGKVGYSVPR